MVAALIVDVAFVILLGYGGWRLWRHHDEQLGLVMLIATGVGIFAFAYAVLVGAIP